MVKYKILLALFTIALISSVLLSLNAPCGEQNVCEQVQKSGYDLIKGTSNGYYGITIFLFLILVTLSQMHKPEKYKKIIIHSGIFIGTIIAIYFLYIQQFVLQEYCKYCIVIDFSLLIAFIIAIFTWKN